MVDHHRNILEHIAVDLYEDEEGTDPQFWGQILQQSVLWKAMPKILIEINLMFLSNINLVHCHDGYVLKTGASFCVI